MSISEPCHNVFKHIAGTGKILLKKLLSEEDR